MKKKLTGKQERFCQEYVVDSNGTRSAIAAGYSKRTADVIAAENLVKPSIAERIAELRAETAKEFKLSKEAVIDMMVDVAKNGEQEANRVRCIDMLGKVIGVYEEDNSQQATQIAVQYYAPKKNKDK